MKALEGGMKILGFSDHVPMPFSKEGYRSRFRMSLEELPVYVETILGLKEKYKNDITLYLGFEAEYYPREFERMMKLLGPYPIDYLILGQHFTNNEYDGEPTTQRHGYDALASLVDTYITAMDTGVFTYIAHPDLLPYEGAPELYEEQMTRLITHAVRTGTPLEYNLHGMDEHRFYPNPAFWALVRKLDASAVIGCDAHCAEKVADPISEAQGRAELASFGITPAETVPLRRPVL